MSSWDVPAIAAGARLQDPGLPPETAELLAAQVERLLAEIGELDAPALARALMAANSHVGATAANVVATAAVGYCDRHGITPASSA